MIDLQAFCGRDPRQMSLHKPFSIGAWSYATDASIIVRVARLTDVPEHPEAPNPSRLPFPDAQTTFVQAPKFGLPAFEASKCMDCAGRGYKHDCPQCSCVCPQCHGTGNSPDDEVLCVAIGDGVFNAKYLRLIEALPNLHFARPSHEDPMGFCFDGGDGLVMPIRGDAEHRIEISDASTKRGAA